MGTEHVAVAVAGGQVFTGEFAGQEEESSEQPPPAKQLRLSDFKEDVAPPDPPRTASDLPSNTRFDEYDANRIHPGDEGGDVDAFLNDFLPVLGTSAAANAGLKDNIHHFFEFLKSEVRELPKARQCMIMDSFFIQLTEAR